MFFGTKLEQQDAKQGPAAKIKWPQRFFCHPAQCFLFAVRFREAAQVLHRYLKWASRGNDLDWLAVFQGERRMQDFVAPDDFL